MYHCHIRFYLIGHPGNVFKILKGMSPSKQFTHEFLTDDGPDAALLAKADVILADLQGMDVKETLRVLISGKRKEAELILFVEKGQVALLGGSLPEIKDIWILPMSDEEIRFHFLRWQESYKTARDYWQTSQYLEATINNIPNLVWYKDKDGIHEKVNDSFCRTVKKTKSRWRAVGTPIFGMLPTTTLHASNPRGRSWTKGRPAYRRRL